MVMKTRSLFIQKIGRSYYRFLKDLKLSDPQYLYAFGSFFEFQRKILENEIVDVPKIGESDIPSGLAKVKTISSDLVGFEEGQYYDILAANAYGRQLTDEIRPLTKKQKENIEAYWKKMDKSQKYYFKKIRFQVKYLENNKLLFIITEIIAHMRCKIKSLVVVFFNVSPYHTLPDVVIALADVK